MRVVRGGGRQGGVCGGKWGTGGGAAVRVWSVWGASGVGLRGRAGWRELVAGVPAEPGGVVVGGYVAETPWRATGRGLWEGAGRGMGRVIGGLSRLIRLNWLARMHALGGTLHTAGGGRILWGGAWGGVSWWGAWGLGWGGLAGRGGWVAGEMWMTGGGAWQIWWGWGACGGVGVGGVAVGVRVVGCGRGGGWGGGGGGGRRGVQVDWGTAGRDVGG